MTVPDPLEEGRKLLAEWNEHHNAETWEAIGKWFVEHGEALLDVVESLEEVVRYRRAGKLPHEALERARDRLAALNRDHADAAPPGGEASS